MSLTSRKERTLGRAIEKRRYDLPLARGAGTDFLVLLVGLMTFLAVLAMAASFALSAMTARWTSGLENRLTVEIPAEDEQGKLLNRAEMQALTARVAGVLEVHPSVESLHVLTDQEIADLIRPWLGGDVFLQDIPLPGLIGVELKESDGNTIEILASRIQNLVPAARLDTHETWLQDLLRFTGALQFAAALLTLVIGVTTATAVAGAISSRMAVHREEVQILHLMGATDQYIARQFERHSLIMALQGGFAGMLAGAAALLLIGWMSGEMDVNLVPDFRLSIPQILLMAALPLAAALIAVVTANRTVHSVLKKFP